MAEKNHYGDFRLPVVTQEDIVEGRMARVHRMPPGKDRWRERSRFFQGFAEAMADQWGGTVDDDQGRLFA